MEKTEVSRRLKDIVDNPINAINEYREASKNKVYGYFCTYTPEEIIHASGAIPFRILGQKKKVTNADTHLQSYSCSLVRTGLDMALLGDLNFMEGAIFPHTCDSIQRLSDIWRLNTDYAFHADIVLPVQLHTESAKTYMYEVLEEFRRDIETHTKSKITDEALRESIRLYNEMRGMLKKLYEIRKESPGIITSATIYDCVNAAMFMPVEEVNRLFMKLLDDIGGGKDESNRIRIVLSGNLCVFDEVYDFIDGAGGAVVGDDMCTGYRYFANDVDENIEDPIEALTDRLIKRPICAAKHNPDFDRGKFLEEVVNDSNADGVIFLLLKFCDPHSFDYPYLKESLDKIGVPHLHLETEMDNPAPGQIKTRIEAFMEMLGS